MCYNGSMTKLCGMCKKDLPTENFAFKNKTNNKLQKHYKKYQKKYKKTHYKSNKQKYIGKSIEWRKARRLKFFNWLNEQSCVDCGISDVRVLEFDHLDPSVKEYNISQIIEGPEDKLQKELNKCDIVCANCHRIRTAKQFNYYVGVV